ncbi:MAG: TetR/AcrR family transcriptional regulator [Lachnospiraceae bacterium]|nr:TetR/AcrR family transcriptional regulator [Lachnospiraceae bacterium]
MTRKEQKEERRKAILMTALRLFVERGYHDTKITDIAEAVPMSTGLLFHYFGSKEELLLELVRMGCSGPGTVTAPDEIPPDAYLTGFLRNMFSFAKEQPWVFCMFVLMGQVRRPGMPEEARKLAQSVDAVSPTVKLIKRGQKAGVFHSGDAVTMATCFWCSVQGIMEQMAADERMKMPEPEWIVGMLRS